MLQRNEKGQINSKVHLKTESKEKSILIGNFCDINKSVIRLLTFTPVLFDV